MTTLNVLVLEGDHIGPEVTKPALAVLEEACEQGDIKLTTEHALFGGAAIDEYGNPATDECLKLATEADAVLLGAVGGPKWDSQPPDNRPERGLLKLRSTMGTFANLRPAKIFKVLADASPLRADIAAGLDFLVVRELIGGIYFGEPRGKTDDRGVNTMVYSKAEVERIGRMAFEAARQRDNKVCSVDKANVLESMMLWRAVMTELGKEYPDVELSHMYVDNCAMQVILNPAQFDVLVCGNLFGDIISDESAAATGSIGLLPSASVGEKNGLFEPIHGSAPDIAGQGKANPLATILSAAMLLEHGAKRRDLAQKIETAVEAVLEDGLRTGDLMRGEQAGTRLVGTQEMGDAVLAKLRG